VRGLIRGIDAAILRTSMGSSVRAHFSQRPNKAWNIEYLCQVQLPSYNWTKNQIVMRGWMPANSIWTYLASSSISGMCVVRLISQKVKFQHARADLRYSVW
jgi:solute carrier family 25 protein 34/35